MRTFGRLPRLGCAAQCYSLRSLYPTRPALQQQQQHPAVDASSLKQKIAASAYLVRGSPPPHHEIWTREEVESVKEIHTSTRGISDKLAFGSIKVIRFLFDLFSGYKFGPLTSRKFLRRALFLETVAGIPGMVSGALRHLTSLRKMRGDHGWIPTLLEEAENERVHMLTFMEVYRPNIVLRAFVLISQGVFWNVYFIAYLLAPSVCHRFVGYLEEEAVHTYTFVLDEMTKAPAASDLGRFAASPAPELAKKYWALGTNATMRDVILAVRADEAQHRDVNHALAEIKPCDNCPFSQDPDVSKV